MSLLEFGGLSRLLCLGSISYGIEEEEIVLICSAEANPKVCNVAV